MPSHQSAVSTLIWIVLGFVEGWLCRGGCRGGGGGVVAMVAVFGGGG